MADEPVFIFLATYDTEADAKLDYDAVKELHSVGVVGTYDAAVITKDADGKIKVHKHEKPTQHGAWTGVAVGAVLGILFPPGLVVGRSKLDEALAKALTRANKVIEKEIKKAEKDAE